MKKTFACLLASATAFAASPAVAGDIFMQVEGFDGGAQAAPIPVDSWSFGACNAGQCTTLSSPRDSASGRKVTVKGWNPETKQGRLSAIGCDGGPDGCTMATGDPGTDGSARLSTLASTDSVKSLTLTFAKATPQLFLTCGGGKPANRVILQIGGDTYEITDAAGTCTSNAAGAAAKGINGIDSTPARISTNFTVGKQTQTQSFGEKVQSGLAQAGSIVVQFTSGQMKHTKTGHVTLLK